MDRPHRPRPISRPGVVTAMLLCLAATLALNVAAGGDTIVAPALTVALALVLVTRHRAVMRQGRRRDPLI